MIEVEERSHEVMENRPSWRQAANNIDMEPVETANLVRTESLEIQAMRRIRFGNSEIR